MCVFDTASQTADNHAWPPFCGSPCCLHNLSCVQIAWTAYLSTLSHVPIVDVDDIGSQLRETQSQLFDALPKEVQSQASQAALQAAKAAQDTLRAVDTLLPRGQHFGLDLTIPKTIEIRPTRAMPGFLGSLLGKE